MKTKGKREPSKITTDGSKTTLKESAKTGICIAERMQNPANYRGITVTKIFTKIIQSILKSRVDIQIDQIQKPATKRIYRSNSYAICSFHSIRGDNRIQHK
jgi:Fe-S cluster assembly ATPase SufC